MNTNETGKKVGKKLNYGNRFRWMVFFSILTHMVILHLILPGPPDPLAGETDTNHTYVDVTILPPKPPTPPPLDAPKPTPKPASQRKGPPKPVPQNPELDTIEPPVIEDPIRFDPPDTITDMSVEIEEPVVEDRLYHLSEVNPPVAIRTVKPEYPMTAKRIGIRGMVVLQAVISRKGVPRDIKVLRSLNSMCDRAAVEAFEQWVYTPGTLNGIPVDVLMTLVVSFKMN